MEGPSMKRLHSIFYGIACVTLSILGKTLIVCDFVCKTMSHHIKLDRINAFLEETTSFQTLTYFFSLNLFI